MELKDYTFQEISKEYNKRLNERKPKKEKKLTCRNCKFRISATNLNIYYKKNKLFNSFTNSFSIGHYCIYNKELLEYNKAHFPTLVGGLKHLACENYKE